MFKLTGAVQNYAWGRIGNQSEVANLYYAGTDSSIDNSKPYAELWMGTHPKGPSRIADTGELLSDVIDQQPHLLGTHEHGQLQFLFKVLSVDKALSIQTHPTKDQAKRLHQLDPANYPDDNHKPEMAIALTPFEMLCGFRPAAEIASLIQSAPELQQLIDDPQSLRMLAESTDTTDQKRALQQLFTRLMKADGNRVRQTISTLVDRLQTDSSIAPFSLKDLIVRLNEQYPGGDVGVLAPYFLNHFFLDPGEASFLGPNEPHAYLAGDCIECMACSDNTIRAGLTPKFKDVDELCTSLTYKMASSDTNKYASIALDANTTLYAPPVDEFAVHRIKDLNDDGCTLAVLPSASILLVVHGEAHIADIGVVHRGDVIFIGANKHVIVTQPKSSFEAFRAFTPITTTSQK